MKRPANHEEKNQDLLDLLPTEVLFDHIIAHDLLVFGPLICASKKWYNTIITTRPDIYYVLFKNNFPNQWLMLRELIYCSTIEPLVQLMNCYGRGNGRGDVMARLFTINPNNEILRTCIVSRNSVHHDAYLRDEYTLLSLDYEDLLQCYKGYEFQSYTCELFQSHRLRAKSRHDPVFAARVSRLYGLVYPFGLPHASHYMQSHDDKRKLVIKMIRVALLEKVPAKDIDAFLYDTFAVIARRNDDIINAYIIAKEEEMASLTRSNDVSLVEDVVRDHAVSLVEEFDFATPGLEEITLDSIIVAWQEKIGLPFVTPSFKNTVPISEKLYYIDNLYDNGYAERLNMCVNGTLWNAKDEAVVFYRECVLRAVQKSLYHLGILRPLEGFKDHYHQLTNIYNELAQSGHCIEQECRNSSMRPENVGHIKYQSLLYRAISLDGM